MLQRWTDYISYAGTFDVDVKSKSVIHHVDISLFPNNVGHDQVRDFVFGKEEETGTQLSATFPLRGAEISFFPQPLQKLLKWAPVAFRMGSRAPRKSLK